MPLILRSPDEVATKLSITIFGQAASNALYKTYSGEVVRIGESALAANMAATLGNLTNAQFATTILTNTGLGGNAALQSALEALLGAGAPRGQLALNLGRVLDTLTADVTFGAAAKTWVATQDAAFGYSSSANSNQSISIAALGVVAGSVTLQASVDKVSGTIFNALRGFTPGGTNQVNTLNDDDELTGTGTSNTLKFTFVNDSDTNDYDIQPILKNVQNIEVAFATDGGGGVASLDLQDADAAVDSIQISRIDSDLVFASVNNLIDNVSKIEIKDSNARSTQVEVLFTNNAVAANAQSTSLTLNNVQTQAVRVESDDNGNAGGAAVAGLGIETIAITSTGANANMVGVLAAEDVETITIDGAQNLMLGGTGNIARGGNIVEATRYSAGLANVGGSLNTVNASAMTGALTYVVGNEIDFTTDGTSGSQIQMSITGGAGNDRIILTTGAVVGGTATTNTDIIDGGAGTNTLMIVGNSAVNAAATANVRKVQNLEIRTGHDDLNDAEVVEVNADAFDSLAAIRIRNEGATFNGLTNNFDSAQENMTVTLTALTAAQATNIAVEHGTTGNSGVAQNVVNVAFKTAGSANATQVSIEDNLNIDPVFNMRLNARSSELVTFVDNDTESNTVYLTDTSGRTTNTGSTLTVLPGAASDAGRYFSFDTNSAGANAAGGTTNGYGRANDGTNGDNTISAAATLDSALNSVYGTPSTLTTTPSTNRHVFYGTDGNGTDNADRLTFENISAVGYAGNLEVRLDEIARADNSQSMSITGGDGNDTFIFDALASTSAGFTAADTVAGGKGQDTLVIDGNTAAIPGTPRIDHQTSEWNNLSGIDVLRFGNNAGIANGGVRVANTAGAYNAVIDSEFVQQTDAGNRLTIVNNDGNLALNSESDLVLDLTGLSQNLWVTFVGANATTGTVGTKNSNRLIVSDVSANENMILNGGDTNTAPNTAVGNLNVYEVRNNANVSVRDLAQTRNFGEINFTNDAGNDQKLVLTLNNAVHDQLVDASNTPTALTNQEVLRVISTDNGDFGSSLQVDARTLTGFRALLVVGSNDTTAGTISPDLVELNINNGGSLHNIDLGAGVRDRVNLYGGTSTATIAVTMGAAGTVASTVAGVTTTHTVVNVEHIDLSSTSLSYVSSTIAGNAAAATAETLTGGVGADSITANDGDDSLSGFGGADTLVGGTGADTILGGAGNDTIVINGTADIAAAVGGVERYDGGADTDTLSVTADTDFTGVVVLDSIESITAADGVDLVFDAAALNGDTITVNGSGDNGGETLTVNGTANADTINLAGLTLDNNDFSGAVVVAGDLGDTVTGTARGDTITGGTGSDDLTGGDGSDVFIYAVGDASTVGFADLGPVASTAVAPGAGDTFTGVEVIRGLITGDTIRTGNTSLIADAGTVGTLEANEFVLVAGTYVGTVFTVVAGGADTLVIYDANSAVAGVQQAAIVLVGVSAAEAAAVTVTAAGAGGGVLGGFGA